MVSTSFLPFYENNWWLYRTDNGSVTVRVSGIDMIDIVPCFLLETSIGSEVLQHECIEINKQGIWLRARQIEGKRLMCIPPYPILFFPVSVGSQWEWKGTIGGQEMLLSFNLSCKENVKVPAGQFSAFRISIEEHSHFGTGNIQKWYSEGVGMVKEISQYPGNEYKADLVDFKLGG